MSISLRYSIGNALRCLKLLNKNEKKLNKKIISHKKNRESNNNKILRREKVNIRRLCATFQLIFLLVHKK